MIKITALTLTLLFCCSSLYAAGSGLVDDKDISSVEERRILVSIEDEYAKLDELESKLNAREMKLKTLEMEVDKKIAAMQQLRNELVKLLDRKEETEGERIGELSKIYEKMDPKKAAALIRTLDHQLAVDLLLGIKKKIAGKILESLDYETATELSKAFTEIPVKNNSGN
jgi:flagellar motility protein MotE (MotC chaperone)